MHNFWSYPTLTHVALALWLAGCVAPLEDEAYNDPDGGIGSTTEALSGPFQIPFACGSKWRGNTYGGHNLKYAVDFNQGSCDDDKGKYVRAAKRGTVLAVKDWTTSYGKHVIIGHGDGVTTLYAHLRGHRVSKGQWVKQGQIIGSVGETGNAGGCSHLHYEMRRNGSSVKARFNGSEAYYWGERTYTSHNCN